MEFLSNVKLTKLYEDTEYVRPKKTITDLLQTTEEVQKKLEGFSEVTDDELKHNDFVRYIKYDPIKKRELFRTGGNVLRNAKDYVTIRGKNNLIFSVSKYVKDNNGDIIYNTRFFKKLNNDDIFKKDVQKILEKSNELIKKQTKIIQSLQKEIEMLKNL